MAEELIIANEKNCKRLQDRLEKRKSWEWAWVTEDFIRDALDDYSVNSVISVKNSITQEAAHGNWTNHKILEIYNCVYPLHTPT